jgi:hypothetical protein
VQHAARGRPAASTVVTEQKAVAPLMRTKSSSSSAKSTESATGQHLDGPGGALRAAGYQAWPSPQAGQVTLAVTAAVKALPQPHM